MRLAFCEFIIQCVGVVSVLYGHGKYFFTSRGSNVCVLLMCLRKAL